MINSKKGFTLVELLVVVAIIGILATIVIMNVIGAKAKARDSKRISDINEMGRLIQRYYEDIGSFPDNVNVIPGVETKACLFPFDQAQKDSCTGVPPNLPEPGCDFWKEGCLAGISGGANPARGLVTEGYISELPSDPLYKFSEKYLYWYFGYEGDGAILMSKLETIEGKSISGAYQGSSTATSLCANPGDDLYCIKVIP